MAAWLGLLEEHCCFDHMFVKSSGMSGVLVNVNFNEGSASDACCLCEHEHKLPSPSFLAVYRILEIRKAIKSMSSDPRAVMH